MYVETIPMIVGAPWPKGVRALWHGRRSAEGRRLPYPALRTVVNPTLAGWRRRRTGRSLAPVVTGPRVRMPARRFATWKRPTSQDHRRAAAVGQPTGEAPGTGFRGSTRSEERRVGKECR